MLRNFIIIFFIGMLGIWKAVPAGFLLKTPPIFVWLMTSSGAIASVLLICLFGNWFKARYLKKTTRNVLKKKKRVKAILAKYGIIGLGVLGPIVMGPNFSLVTGLIVSDQHKKLMVWTIVGILFWSAVLTVLAALSVELLALFSIKHLFKR